MERPLLLAIRRPSLSGLVGDHYDHYPARSGLLRHQLLLPVKQVPLWPFSKQPYTHDAQCGMQ